MGLQNTYNKLVLKVKEKHAIIIILSTTYS